MKRNFTYNDELYHYGVKGMRWRHRKPGAKPIGKDPTGAGEVNSRAVDYQGNPVSRRDMQIHGLHRLAYKEAKNIPLNKLGEYSARKFEYSDSGFGSNRSRSRNQNSNPGHHRVQGFGNAAYQRELRGTRERDSKTSGSASGTDRHYRSTYKAKRNRK